MPDTPLPSNIGNTGLRRLSGYIYEEFLPNLNGARAMQVYKEMESNDAIVGAFLFAIDMFMRKVDWTVEPAGEDKKSVEDAQFLRECKDDMSITWNDFISEVMSMLPYGWSWFEINYKQRTDNTNDPELDPADYNKYHDNKVGWEAFSIRSQDSLDKWEWNEQTGAVAAMVQKSYPDFVERRIPIKKSLLFRTTSRKNNPEGKSVLRNAYRSWYFKKRIEEIEGIGIERDLAGLPIAEVPAEMLAENASADDKATVAVIAQLVQSIRRDEMEGIVWPQAYDEAGHKLYELRLMNSGGTRQFSTDQTITRYEQRMAMVVLADFILLGNEVTASLALSTNKAGMFQAALGSWLDSIASVLNDFAVPRLFAMNGIKGPFPKFVHEDVQEPSLQDLAVFISALAGAGASLFPDVDLENRMREIAKLPLREPKPELVETEDELRQQRVEAELAGQLNLKENPGGPPAANGAPVTGKQPDSAPGAPTKRTGPNKSTLPPKQKRPTETGSTVNGR